MDLRQGPGALTECTPHEPGTSNDLGPGHPLLGRRMPDLDLGNPTWEDHAAQDDTELYISLPELEARWVR